LRRLSSSLACTGGLRQACALRHLSSRAVCISCGLRRRSCIRLAADITLGLAPLSYILQSSWPAYLQLSLQVSPVSCSQRFSFGLAPSAALSGRASNELAPTFRADWRPAPTLIACRIPARPQCNPRLAPRATCLWQRRRLNPRLTPVIASFGKAGDQFPDLGWPPHLRLAPVACCPSTSVP